jgi:hypothetical protein
MNRLPSPNHRPEVRMQKRDRFSVPIIEILFLASPQTTKVRPRVQRKDQRIKMTSSCPPIISNSLLATDILPLNGDMGALA